MNAGARSMAGAVLIGGVVAALVAGGCSSPSAPVALRLQVSLTADELETFRPALETLDQAHPEFTVSLEAVPQESEAEKVNTLLAGDDLPDVLRIQGLNAQQWIRRDAFMALDQQLPPDSTDLADFYAGPLDQFRYAGKLWGVPDTASPEVVYFDRQAFADAGLAPPTDSWTYDDMRVAAVALTVDESGRHPTEAGFDPQKISRWGWNGGVTYFWQNALVKGRGGDLCANPDCTLMNFTSEANRQALEWWVTLVRDDHAALYDPYGGSQTGIQGDPFITGRSAMGSNGAFAVGQLNAAGTVDYDIVPPLLSVDGNRYTPLSTNGYVISAKSAHPDEAWALVKALTAADFLSQTWARPGHGVPARRSAAGSVVDSSHPPANQAAILSAMEAGEVFRPSTSSAFAAYGATADLFTKMNTGELSIDDALARIESAANEALAPDRSP